MGTITKEFAEKLSFFQESIMTRINNKKDHNRFVDNWVEYEEFYNDYDDASGYYDEDSQ